MCTPWKHIGGVKVQFHSFVTSAMDGDERLDSFSGHFTPEKSVAVPAE
jgi:hypothetical protein